jgi:membrane-bound serine protease (ClpP class)
MNVRGSLYRWLLLLLVACPAPSAKAAAELTAPPPRVFVLPIRENIMPPLTYLVRRGVKQAMDARADLLILDMKTDGGRVDVTEEIIQIIGQFRGRTATYVNDRAFSAGAFIAVATQEIYMAPQSVIGAAAPIMMIPGGGAQEMPDTMEAKMNSAVRALVRSQAERHGHNVEVIEAMIDKNRELIIDGHTINRKGDILTLTDTEAAREYGDPPKPLLSAGTIENLDALIARLGSAGAQRVDVQPTGAEQLAFWLNALNWLWLILGVAGIYLEFKTPGFGLPGIVGLSAFAVYFLGSYIAGLSGLEWPMLFVLGLSLVVLELFVFPGTIVLGMTGGLLMLITVVMAMVDRYPGMPALPTLPQLRAPLADLLYAAFGSVVLIAILARFLPKTSIYGVLVSKNASAMVSVAAQVAEQERRVGREGVAVSTLRPGGKAQFGDEILDVMTQGDLIEKGTRVRIVAHSGREAVVEPTVGPG